jgi:hypothetical protein
MSPEVAAADRKRQVQLAARGWHDAGAITEATRTQIEERFPDDRARLGPAFRTLAFLFTCVAVYAMFGVVMLALNCGRSSAEDPAAAFAIAFGAALVAATEMFVGPMRRADSGVEAASAWLAVSFLSGGLAWMAEKAFDSDFTGIFLIAAVVCAVAAYRWGFAFLALFAALAGFGLLARMPAGRLLWIAVPLLLAVPLLKGLDSARLSPSHRRCCQAVLLVSVVALYVAVHLGSFDHRFVETFVDWDVHDTSLPSWMRPLSVLATALFPIALLALAVFSRRVTMMKVAILLGVASLVTLRFYVSVAPLWVVLLAAGTAALLVVLGVRRALASGVDCERGGFTALPLFEDREKREALEMMSAVASLSPGARTLPAGDDKLTPGGGRYGGGGASDTY